MRSLTTIHFIYLTKKCTSHIPSCFYGPLYRVTKYTLTESLTCAFSSKDLIPPCVCALMDLRPFLSESLDLLKALALLPPPPLPSPFAPWVLHPLHDFAEPLGSFARPPTPLQALNLPPPLALRSWPSRHTGLVHNGPSCFDCVRPQIIKAVCYRFSAPF